MEPIGLRQQRDFVGRPPISPPLIQLGPAGAGAAFLAPEAPEDPADGTAGPVKAQQPRYLDPPQLPALRALEGEVPVP